MNAYSDEELLAVYENRSQYTPEAIEAMETVLLERDLIEHAEKIVADQKEEEKLTKEAIYDKFQRTEFGSVIPDAEFAQGRLKNSIYLERFISPVHHYNWVNHIFIVLGGIGLTIALIILGLGDFDSEFIKILVASSAVSPLLFLGIRGLSRNKAKLTVVKKMNRNAIVIMGRKDHYEFSLPLRYDYYWEWIQIKRNMKQVRLSVLLYDEKNDICIELRETIELLKPPPPHWERLPKKFTISQSSSFIFLNHGFQKPFLYELQKILNGLHES